MLAHVIVALIHHGLASLVRPAAALRPGRLNKCACTEARFLKRHAVAKHVRSPGLVLCAMFVAELVLIARVEPSTIKLASVMTALLAWAVIAAKNASKRMPPVVAKANSIRHSACVRIVRVDGQVVNAMNASLLKTTARRAPSTQPFANALDATTTVMMVMFAAPVTWSPHAARMEVF